MIRLRTLIFIALLLCPACVKRVPLTTAQTIQLNSNIAIGTLAESVRAATALTISLSNNNLISVPQTRVILGYTGDISNVITASVLIQQSGRSDSEKAFAIMRLLSAVKIPESVSAFIRNPNNSGQIAALISLLNIIVSNIHSLSGVG